MDDRNKIQELIKRGEYLLERDRDILPDEAMDCTKLILDKLKNYQKRLQMEEGKGHYEEGMAEKI